MLEICGWLGAVFFAICGIPQAYKSYKEGHSRGVSNWMLWFWLLGEVLSLIYILPQMLLPIIANYILNLLSLIVIMYYKYFER